VYYIGWCMSDNIDYVNYGSGTGQTMTRKGTGRHIRHGGMRGRGGVD
jgi:hypothetical protein